MLRVVLSQVDEQVANDAVTVTDDPVRYDAAWQALGRGAYHHPGWRRVFSVYGLWCHCLVAESDNQPVGLLPLVRQSSMLFGRRLISLPWVDEAGAIGDPTAIAALLRHAAEMTERLGRRHSLLVKQPLQPVPTANSEDLGRWRDASAGKVLMRTPLGRTSTQLWKDLSAKVRNQVRKAEKSGLTTERGGAELLDDFFQVYSHNMRDLGSPSHSRAFFQVLFEELGERVAVYVTRLEGLAIGAGVVLDNGASLDIPWASSLREHNRLCVNHALYWRVLSDACDAGYAWFHFGRSTVGSGQQKFKKQWGAEEASLDWRHWPNHPADNDQEQADPSQLRANFSRAEQAWSRLPLWASRWLGPHVIRYAP